MWALVKEKPEAGLWMKRVPIPEVGPNDVKIKIHKTAICGTDVHIYQWNEWAQHTIPVGLTAGHEYVGEVVEVGPGVQGFKIGDLVSGEGHITCGKCRNCLEGHKENCKDAKGVGVNRNGAFAEYLVIPSSNVWPWYGHATRIFRKRCMRFLIRSETLHIQRFPMICLERTC